MELEELIVRLTGDVQQYVDALKEAKDKTGESMAAVKQDVEETETGVTASMTAMGASLVAVGAAIGAAFGSVMHEALGNFQEAEAIGIKLNAVLESNGEEVKSLTDDYLQWAAAMEKASTIEDDAAVKLITMAQTMRTTGDQAKKAVEDAIAIAAVNDGAAESYVRFTAAMARGDTEVAMTMARMIPQLRGIKNESQFLAEAAKLVAAGQKAAKAEMESSSGQIKILRRDYGNMLEDLGKVVADGLKPLISAALAAVETFRALPDGVKITIAATMGMAVAAGIAAVAIGGYTLAVANLNTALVKNAVVTNLAKLGAFAWQTALVGVAVYGAYKLIAAFTDLDKKIEEHNDAMRRSKELSDDLARGAAGRFDQVMVKVSAAEGPHEKMMILAKEEEIQRKIIANYQKVVDELEAAGLETEGVQKSLAAAEQVLEKLGKEVMHIFHPEKDPKLISDVDEYTKSLKLQLETMRLTAEEAKILELKKRGATDAQLLELEQMRAAIEETREAIKAEEELAQAQKNLEEEMKRKGEALMEEGKQIKESLATPTEKYASAIEHLNELLEKGALDQETYTRAVEDARKRWDDAMGTLDGVKEAAKEAKQQILQFDAALAGSAEAKFRVQAFLDSVSGDRVNRPLAAQAGQAVPDLIVGGKQDKLLEQIRDAVREGNKKETIELEPARLA